MPRKSFIVSGVCLCCIFIVVAAANMSRKGIGDNDFNQGEFTVEDVAFEVEESKDDKGLELHDAQIEQSSLQPLAAIDADSHNTEIIDYDQRRFEEVLSEIRARLAANQLGEALNELDGLLVNYDALVDDDKISVLNEYASFFMKNRQFDDAKPFFEQILLLETDIRNRLAYLQMLSGLAMNSEDWDGFLTDNDRYFDQGGIYNWVVTRNLLNAYQHLENYDAAGQTLLLHLETGINPQYDGSDEKFQQYYGDSHLLPLQQSDPLIAIQLAQRLVSQFDRVQNWKVLAEVYDSIGDEESFNRTMQAAREREYLDSEGNWNFASSQKEGSNEVGEKTVQWTAIEPLL